MANPNINQIILAAEQAVLSGEWQKAREYFKKALETDPQNQRAANGLRALDNKEQCEQEILSMVADADQAKADGNYENALDLYQRAYNLSADSGILKHQNSVEQKRQETRKIRDWQLHSAERLRVAEDFLRKNESEAAYNVFSKLLDDLPKDGLFSALCAEITTRRNELEAQMDADGLVRKAKKALDAEDFKTALRLAKQAQPNAKSRKVKDIEDTAQEGLNFVESRLGDAQKAFDEGRWDDSFAKLNEIRAVFSSNPDYQELWLQVAMKHGKLLLRDAEQIFSRHNFSAAEKKSAEALAAFDKVLEKYTSHDEALTQKKAAQDLEEIATLMVESYTQSENLDLKGALTLIQSAQTILAAARKNERPFIIPEAIVDGLAKELQEAETQIKKAKIDLARSHDLVENKHWDLVAEMLQEHQNVPLPPLREQVTRSLGRAFAEKRRFDDLCKEAAAQLDPAQAVATLKNAYEVWPAHPTIKVLLVDGLLRAAEQCAESDPEVATRYLFEANTLSPSVKVAAALERLALAPQLKVIQEQAYKKINELDQAEDFNLSAYQALWATLVENITKSSKYPKLVAPLAFLRDKLAERISLWQPAQEQMEQAGNALEAGQWEQAIQILASAKDSLGKQSPKGLGLRLETCQSAWKQISTQIGNARTAYALTKKLYLEKDFEKAQDAVQAAGKVLDQAVNNVEKLPSAKNPPEVESLSSQLNDLQQRVELALQVGASPDQDTCEKLDLFLAGRTDKKDALDDVLEALAVELREKLNEHARQEYLGLLGQAENELNETRYEAADRLLSSARQISGDPEITRRLKTVTAYRDLAREIKAGWLDYEGKRGHNLDASTALRNLLVKIFPPGGLFSPDVCDDIGFLTGLATSEGGMSFARAWDGLSGLLDRIKEAAVKSVEELVEPENDLSAERRQKLTEQNKDIKNLVARITQIIHEREAKPDEYQNTIRALQNLRDEIRVANRLLFKDVFFADLEFFLDLLEHKDARQLERVWVGGRIRSAQFRQALTDSDKLVINRLPVTIKNSMQEENRIDIYKIFDEWLPLQRNVSFKFLISSQEGLRNFLEAHLLADKNWREDSTPDNFSLKVQTHETLIIQTRDFIVKRIEIARDTLAREQFDSVLAYLNGIRSDAIVPVIKTDARLFDDTEHTVESQAQEYKKGISLEDAIAELDKLEAVTQKRRSKYLEIAPRIQAIRAAYEAGDLEAAAKGLRELRDLSDLPSLKEEVDYLGQIVANERIHTAARSLKDGLVKNKAALNQADTLEKLEQVSLELLKLAELPAVGDLPPDHTTRLELDNLQARAKKQVQQFEEANEWKIYGQQAFDAGNFEEASGYFQQALEAAEGGSERARLSQKLGEARTKANEILTQKRAQEDNIKYRADALKNGQKYLASANYREAVVELNMAEGLGANVEHLLLAARAGVCQMDAQKAQIEKQWDIALNYCERALKLATEALKLSSKLEDFQAKIEIECGSIRIAVQAAKMEDEKRKSDAIEEERLRKANAAEEEKQNKLAIAEEEKQRKQAEMAQRLQTQKIAVALGTAQKSLRKKDWGAARTALDQVFEFDSANGEALALLGQVEALEQSQKDEQKEKEEASRLIGQEKQINAKLLAARKALAAQKWEQALEHIHQVLEVNINQPDALVLERQVLDERKAKEESERQLVKVQVIVDKARASHDLGQDEEALASLNSLAVSNLPVTSDAHILKTRIEAALDGNRQLYIADSLIASNDFQGAREALKQAMEKSGDPQRIAKVQAKLIEYENEWEKRVLAPINEYLRTAEYQQVLVRCDQALPRAGSPEFKAQLTKLQVEAINAWAEKDISNFSKRLAQLEASQSEAQAAELVSELERVLLRAPAPDETLFAQLKGLRHRMFEVVFRQRLQKAQEMADQKSWLPALDIIEALKNEADFRSLFPKLFQDASRLKIKIDENVEDEQDQVARAERERILVEIRSKQANAKERDDLVQAQAMLVAFQKRQNNMDDAEFVRLAEDLRRQIALYDRTEQVLHNAWNYILKRQFIEAEVDLSLTEVSAQFKPRHDQLYQVARLLKDAEAGYKAGQWESAIAGFRQAEAIEPALRSLLAGDIERCQRGLAEIAFGKIRSYLDAFPPQVNLASELFEKVSANSWLLSEARPDEDMLRGILASQKYILDAFDSISAEPPDIRKAQLALLKARENLPQGAPSTSLDQWEQLVKALDDMQAGDYAHAQKILQDLPISMKNLPLVERAQKLVADELQLSLLMEGDGRQVDELLSQCKYSEAVNILLKGLLAEYHSHAKVLALASQIEKRLSASYEAALQADDFDSAEKIGQAWVSINSNEELMRSIAGLSAERQKCLDSLFVNIKSALENSDHQTAIQQLDRARRVAGVNGHKDFPDLQKQLDSLRISLIDVNLGLEEAERSLSAQDWHSAVTHLLGARRKVPNYARGEKLTDEAQARMQQVIHTRLAAEEFKSARELCELALSLQPNGPLTDLKQKIQLAAQKRLDELSRRVDISLSDWNLEEASRLLDQLQARDPDLPNLPAMLNRLRTQSENAQSLQSLFESAWMEINNGNYASVQGYLQRMLDLAPTFEEARTWLDYTMQVQRGFTEFEQESYYDGTHAVNIAEKLMFINQPGRLSSILGGQEQLKFRRREAAYAAHRLQVALAHLLELDNEFSKKRVSSNTNTKIEAVNIGQQLKHEKEEFKLLRRNKFVIPSDYQIEMFPASVSVKETTLPDSTPGPFAAVIGTLPLPTIPTTTSELDGGANNGGSISSRLDVTDVEDQLPTVAHPVSLDPVAAQQPAALDDSTYLPIASSEKDAPDMLHPTQEVDRIFDPQDGKSQKPDQPVEASTAVIAEPQELVENPVSATVIDRPAQPRTNLPANDEQMLSHDEDTQLTADSDGLQSQASNSPWKETSAVVSRPKESDETPALAATVEHPAQPLTNQQVNDGDMQQADGTPTSTDYSSFMSGFSASDWNATTKEE